MAHSFPVPTTKETYVYEILRMGILDCELKPGTRLVMDRLSEDLGVSPIPIRGALQRLQAEGLVQITPHSGATVAQLDPASATEIFTLAAALDSIVMRVLAPKITPEDLFQLEQIVADIDGTMAGTNHGKWVNLDLDFHSTLASLSGMPLLAEFAIRTQESWYRLYNSYFSQAGPLRMPAAQAEHKQMLSLLAQRNGPALETLMVEHHRQSFQAYQNAYLRG